MHLYNYRSFSLSVISSYWLSWIRLLLSRQLPQQALVKTIAVHKNASISLVNAQQIFCAVSWVKYDENQTNYWCTLCKYSQSRRNLKTFSIRISLISYSLTLTPKAIMWRNKITQAQERNILQTTIYLRREENLEWVLSWYRETARNVKEGGASHWSHRHCGW